MIHNLLLSIFIGLGVGSNILKADTTDTTTYSLADMPTFVMGDKVNGATDDTRLLGFLKNDIGELVNEDDIYFDNVYYHGHFGFCAFLSPYSFGDNIQPLQTDARLKDYYLTFLVCCDSSISQDYNLVLFYRSVLFQTTGNPFTGGDFLGIRSFEWSISDYIMFNQYDFNFTIEYVPYGVNSNDVITVNHKTSLKYTSFYSFHSSYVDERNAFINVTNHTFSNEPFAHGYISFANKTYGDGYVDGYNYGLTFGGSNNVDGGFFGSLTALFGGMGELLNITLLPGITIGGIVVLFVSIPLVFALFKLIRGGE